MTLRERSPRFGESGTYNYDESGTYNYESALGPGRHDGAAKVAVLGWNAACSCFRPTGEPRAI